MQNLTEDIFQNTDDAAVAAEPAGPVIRVAVFVPLPQLFDYLPPKDLTQVLQPGMRVKVPFGQQRKTGMIIELSDSSVYQRAALKPLCEVLDAEPLLSAQDLALLHWVSRYYHHPLGDVIATALPVALRQSQPATLEVKTEWVLSAEGRLADPEQFKRARKQQQLLQRLQAGDALAAIDKTGLYGTIKALQAKGVLIEQPVVTDTSTPLCRQAHLPANPAQQAAISALIARLGQFSVTLLEGVTGSGKTEVYLQVIEQVLLQGRQVLVLLPEIALTPQLEQRFLQRFAVPLVIFHSRLSDKQRLQAWLHMQQGRAAIMLGTRSALFTPLRQPGLIILDEEHDASFKQQEGLRFSARDTAIVRGKQLGVPVLLGSATPSIESLYNVQQGRYQQLHLPQRAGVAVAPVLQLLDIRNKRLSDGLSDVLLDEMRQTLAQGRQVLLFLNRRGYAPVQMCHSCGWIARCQHCEANLVIHSRQQRLRCHHCGDEQPLLFRCPACKTGELRAIGLGTERLEQRLAQLFPEKTVLRLDRDTTQRKGSLDEALQQISEGKADIILGTQMLAKGHHFPGVTLVALLDVDSGLFCVDFHAAERLAQLIVQVSGRAGRAEQPGKVILQTRQPHHPLLTTLLSRGYQAFARETLVERQQAHLPPFSYQALLRVNSQDAEAPVSFLTATVAWLSLNNRNGVWVLGPTPAPMARKAGQFRFQLLLQSDDRKALHQLIDALLPVLPGLPAARQVYYSLDVDPLDLY